MPQMSPMDWFLLMIYFYFIYFLMVIFIYFSITNCINFKISNILLNIYKLKWY